MNHLLNPVSRLLQASNVTEKGFRDTYKYSKQYMVDVTAGTYTRLADKLHVSLAELTTAKGVDVKSLLLSEYDSMTLDEAYILWQTAMRRKRRDIFVSTKPNEFTPLLSPAHFFVKKTSGTPTRFSKELLVPPQQVRRWVAGQTQKTPTPVSIEMALREIAYPHIRELIENQLAWVEGQS